VTWRLAVAARHALLASGGDGSVHRAPLQRLSLQVRLSYLCSSLMVVLGFVRQVSFDLAWRLASSSSLRSHTRLVTNAGSWEPAMPGCCGPAGDTLPLSLLDRVPPFPVPSLVRWLLVMSLSDQSFSSIVNCGCYASRWLSRVSVLFLGLG